jgi:hypothetical protein
LLANLAAYLPQNEVIEKFCLDSPTFTANLGLYVEKLYEDLFELFCAVAKVFTSGNGSEPYLYESLVI